MRILITTILTLFFFFQSSGQSIDMPLDKIKVLLCKKWVEEYLIYGSQKIYYSQKNHDSIYSIYEFKPNNEFLTYYDNKQVAAHGTWEYIPEKKELRFGTKGKHDSVFSLEGNKLITQIKVAGGTPKILHVFKVLN